MTVFTIENYRRKRECYSPARIVDELIELFDVDMPDAIDAESWAELAYYGEVYQGDGFTITKSEE